jgi:hypothetical protein
MSEQADAESIRNIGREKKQKLVSEKKKIISKDVILKRYSEGRHHKKPKAATCFFYNRPINRFISSDQKVTN